MIERYKQKLIAEKGFLLKWIEIVLKATPDCDLEEAKLNYHKIKEVVLTNWEKCDVSCIDISLEFYNENSSSGALKTTNNVFSINFSFMLDGNYIALEIRKDSVDAEGHHSCPQDEEYLLSCCYHEKEEFTFFDVDATQKFLNIFYAHQIKYPNLDLPDIRTDIYFE